MTLKDAILGDYDYAALCMPTMPWKKDSKTQKFQFYEKDEAIPLLVSILMGLQHALAMVGGLITPPYVVFRFTVGANTEYQQYAITAALITSGICTILNVMQLPIPGSSALFGRQLYVGSGVLSVMGTSFTFLPIFEIAIRQMIEDGIDNYDAYGKMLGTSMICCLLEVVFSILPVKVIKKVFPPLVSGIAVLLIGAALTGTGMKYWGGGVVCAETMCSPIQFNCSGNGEVILPYGASQYIGLGFSVACMLVVVELFGSTFMKNCNVIIALLFGYLIAGLTDFEGDLYVDNDAITDADSITFLWVKTFKIGVYGPAFVPLLVAYLVTTVETVGDLGATYEASELDTESKEFDESVQGGLLADSVCSILASLFTSMPNTTFSQNNGVISMTKCASRRAGYACGVWLIVMGILGKIAGLITSIPDCVLGGMTIFLFANVFTSGIKLLGMCDFSSRRVRFIVSLSMAFGLGVTIWPFAFQDRRNRPYTAEFWTCEEEDECSEFLKGVRNGVSIFLSTGYCIGTMTAIVLNTILPEDAAVIKKSDVLEEAKELELDEVEAEKPSPEADSES